ncbi:MAG: DNA mismatch repair protein MutS, partial [Defluviitaleaceae bacterium]|nr:DNA mismatch repair protein MutS [Defluviitaleaceae bacterium]
ILDIKDGKHAVIDHFIDDFVANDIFLDNEDRKIVILTGPNMAGKSTYLRQNALMAIMAQMGSLVPAAYAKIPIFDQIFTRVGASDDIGQGQSTFMVEMRELAHIMKYATSQSLVLLDEVGRGTSTTDGLAIAIATIEHISEKIGAKTLFATHYHELSSAEGKVSGVVNLSMSVEKNGNDIKFLRKVKDGGTKESHGIFVAKMAGLPDSIVKRSEKIHRKLVFSYNFDEEVFEKERGVDLSNVHEEIKRLRFFLEEFASMDEAGSHHALVTKIKELKLTAQKLRESEEK